jgi:hypothetical protein
VLLAIIILDENNTVVKLDDAKHAEPMETVEGSQFTKPY